MPNILGLGEQKDQRTQLYFHDDGTFEFRKLDVDVACLIKRDNKGMPVQAWRHYYKNQYPFNGYKRIQADMVSLGYGRDIVLDPHKILSADELPELDKDINKLDRKGIREIAQSQCYRAENQKGGTLLVDKITTYLGIAVVVLAFAIAIAANL